MTKEEFKCLFLKQFNQEYSAIRALIFGLDPLWRKCLSRYSDFACYSIGEFALDIEIHKLRINDMDFYFEIGFSDAPEVNGEVRTSYMKLDGEEFKKFCKKQFQIESVEFLKNKIKFSLKTYCLSMKGYEFELTLTDDSCELYYDVYKQAFDDKLDVALMLDEWSNRRKNNSTFYMDYPIENAGIEELNNYVHGLNTTQSNKAYLRLAFRGESFCDETTSVMSGIVKLLC